MPPLHREGRGSAVTKACTCCVSKYLELCSEERHGIDEPVQIVSIVGDVLSVEFDHFVGTHSVEIVYVDEPTAQYLKVAVLADFSIALIRASGAVVVEEAVQARTIDQDIVRVDNAQAPAVCIWDREVAILGSRVRELWVEKAGNVRERQRRGWVGLIV